ncbi:polyphosphate kinase 2 [Chitinophaga sp. Hz27]|uniref:polyphosphate kinase 2 n=1 Tax=Chitinophaga sp. Hz27 TaxID=3347169 RepID=UPI0035D8EE49
MKKDKKLNKLYIELVKLQKEIISSQLKLLLILEGRDTAGKDGTIKAITLHLSPRETKIVALSKPSDRQAHEWYFQRYTIHLPAAGEFTLFNRSWYNRAGVEHVMGFCTEKEYISFFTEVALFEKMLTDAGIIILKYYLDISKKEQKSRLEDRKENPLKQWKVSPIDEVALKRWNAYSEARDRMLLETNFKHAPWFVVNADDKDAAHKAIISHLLQQIDYTGKDKKLLATHNDIVFPVSTNIIQKRLYR